MKGRYDILRLLQMLPPDALIYAAKTEGDGSIIGLELVS